jgi:hypothetical protein
MLGTLAIEWLMDSDLLEFDNNRLDDNNPEYIKISKKLSQIVLDKKNYSFKYS